MKNDAASTLDHLTEIETMMQDYEPIVRQSMLIDGQARYVSWDFSKTDHETLELLQITDIQFGHKQCNEEKLAEYLEWVLAQENRYILLCGDLIDAGHPLSKGSPFEQIGDPQTEVWRLVEILAPLRHRILAYVGGNHERRTIPTFGDAGKNIASVLRIPYSPGKQHIDIKFGDHKPFKATLWHGGGSGGTKGAVANQIYKLMMQADSQLYLLGHLHQAMVIPDCRETRDFKGNMIQTKIMGAMGTSFLKHYGTYAEVIMGTRPQTIMMARAILEKNGHWELTLR